MERKKKKLSIEDHENNNPEITPKELEQIEQLFSKKFVYSRNAKWSLESTSVFEQFAKTVSSKYDPKEHICEARPCMLNEAKHSGVSSVNTVDSCNSFTHYAVACEPPHLAETLQNMLPRQCTESLSTTDRSVHGGFSQRKTVSQTSRKTRLKATPVHKRLIKRVKVALPAPWQHDELIAVKDRLNTLKDKLSDKEMVAWHQHTNSTNLAGKVVGEIKGTYHAELCTQAWCKFHEIMACQDVLPASFFSEPHRQLNSIHLCEAPGAFITSLNHYLVSRGFDTQSHWQWLGTTLNPYYEGNDTGRMISDDRFIRTTFDNWFFGRDDSGDLMSNENMLALMERAELMGDIHLITADGSIDCQENPAEQEVIVSRLHHCEVLCSCLLLAPGGTLVIKLFTMLEASSIALLYFLNCVFEKVTVCKPATSKSGNSEVYAVCSGYSAPLSHDALFSVFSAVCASDDPHIVLLAREDIPEEFLAEHAKCCQYFCKLQSDTITQNLALYGNMEEPQKKRLAFLQSECAKHYVKVCSIQAIDDEDRIRAFGYKSNFSRFLSCRPNQDRFNKSPRSAGQHAFNGIGSGSVSLPLGRLQGTFQQRQQQNQFPWQQLLTQIHDYPVDEGGCATIRCRHQLTEKEMREWKVQTGRVFDVVASSFFCEPRMLGDVQLMLQHAQVKLHQQKALAEHSVTTLSEAFQLLHTACLFNHHHHHHHSHNPITALYHLAMEGSVTSFWSHGSVELSQTLDHRRLSCVEDLRGLGEGAVGLVVDVTCPSWLGQEEIQCQTRLLEVMSNICSYVQSGSTVVFIMPLALTRLTAGLLYIFASLFQEISCSGKGESMFLHQTLCFHNLSYPTYTLLHLLETLRHAFTVPQTSTHVVSCHDAAPQQKVGSDRCLAENVISGRHVGHSMPVCHESAIVDMSSQHGTHSCKRAGIVTGSQSVAAGGGGGMSCHGRMESRNGAHSCEAHEKDESENGRNGSTASSGVSDGAKNHSSHLQSHHRGLECVSTENANSDTDRRMSHDDSIVPGDCQVDIVVPSDTDSDRRMSHDGDVGAVHNENGIRRMVSVDRQMSVDADSETASKFLSAGATGMKQSVSATHSSRDSLATVVDKLSQSCPDKSNNHSASETDRAELKSHPTSARECDAENQIKYANRCNTAHFQDAKGSSQDAKGSSQFSCGRQRCSNSSCHHCAASHHTHSAAESTLCHQNSTPVGSSLHPQGSKVLMDNACDPAGGGPDCRHSSSVQPEEERDKEVRRESGNSCWGGGGSGLAPQIPLEVVPVLQIVNDVTFTRFLQTSNRRSMSGFLRTVKAAEQRYLASQPPTT